MHARATGAVIAAALAGLLLALPTGVAAQDAGSCFGELDREGVERKPGPAMRFGVTPGVQTGQLGTGAVPPRTPEDPAKHLAALARLRAPGKPFVLRLHRFFWSDGEKAFARFDELTRRYTRAGYAVEFQVRYHPAPEREGDIEAWVAHVREVVRRFGRNPAVVALQITNEVNLTFSPDSSDGAYDRARDALIEGVVAAKDEARRRGYHQLEIGFNWAYRTDPGNESSFWNYLRDRGGKRFVDSVDWVGLDAYPGTFFPPTEVPGEEGDGLLNAMSTIRCLMKVPAIPESVPIHIEENGYPTNDTPDRSEDRQVTAMKSMIGTADEFRGTYNISDYRWFNLRDGDSTRPNHQTRYGLMKDDYSEKRGFAEYARIVRELGGGKALRPEAARLTQRCARGRLRARVSGNWIENVVFSLDRRRLRRDSKRPFGALVPKGGRRARAVVTFRSGATTTLASGTRRC